MDVHELRVKAREALSQAEATAEKWELEGRDARPDEKRKYERLMEKADRLALNLTMAENDEFARRQRIQEARKLTLSQSPAWAKSDARVTSEPATYQRGGPNKFFRDVVRAEIGSDHETRERLARHQQEQRDLSSTDGVGGDLVPPRWLMDETVTLARAGRPYANSINNRPLPAFTDSILLPKVSTGSSVAAQADLGTVSETDPTTGSVSIPVKTLAGQVDVSRQVLDRGQYADDVLFGDLIADYNLRIDLQCLTGSGSGANAKGILSDANRISVTWSGATPTVAELYSKIQDASQQIATQRFLPRRLTSACIRGGGRGSPLSPTRPAVR